jgi:DNA-binding beta-propeller fold protein YncE
MGGEELKRALLLTIALLGATTWAMASMTVNTVAPDAPMRPPQFEVDPAWPKPLPNRWLMGQAAGVAVDRNDHVWVIQRPKSLSDDEKGASLTPPRSTCCIPAPPVLQFDADGTLLQSWGGPGAGYAWPANEHGIYVDFLDHVWIAGNGPKDGQILKFTKSGKHVLTIGAPGVVGDDADPKHLNRPANMIVDPQAHELFVADGYGNHRVIVFDAQTGAYKRHWGANGRPPGTAGVKPFSTPVHGLRLARDGLLYVCDRPNNRIQVFRKDGTFVKEFTVAPDTKGNGSMWDVDLSPDQSVLHVADGENNVVWNLARDTGRVLGSFGRRGRGAGQFHWIHNLAVDSKGNVYTTEVDSGKRAQKFVNKGR